MAETKTSKLFVRELNEVLVCHLCRGYMINPTIVDNCYHTYCRSCIVRHLYGNSFCPECKQSPDPNRNGSIDHTHLKSDDTLRSLIYKLIPGLYHKERERSLNYAAAVKNGQNNKLCDNAKETDTDEDIEFFSPTEPISLSLEYHPLLLENCRATEHAPLVRYLQCPASVKIRHLKRFLTSKYSLDPQGKRVEVEIIYDDEVLPPEFTLMDVGYCYNWKRHAPMRFTYRILYFGVTGPNSAQTAAIKLAATTKAPHSAGVYARGDTKDKPPRTKPTKSVSFSDTVDLVSFEKTTKSKKSAKRHAAGGCQMTTDVGDHSVTTNAPVKVVIARNRSTATTANADCKKQSPKRNDYRCEDASSSTSSLSSYAITTNSANDFKSLRSNDMRYSDYTVTSSSVITAERKRDKERKSLAASSSHKSPEALVVVSIPRGAATNSSSSSSPSDDLFENMSLAQLKTANKKTTPPKPPQSMSTAGYDTKPKRNVPKLKIELNSLKTTLSIAPKCKSADIADNGYGESKKSKHRKHSLDEGFVSMSDRVDIKTYAKNIGLKPIDGSALPSPSSSDSMKYSPNASPMSSSSSASSMASTCSSNGNGNHYALLDATSSSALSSPPPPVTFHKKRKKKHSKDSKESKDSKRRKLHAEISSQPAEESLKMKVKITPAGAGAHYHHHHHHHYNQYKQNTYTIQAPDTPKTSIRAEAEATKKMDTASSAAKVEIETSKQNDHTQHTVQQQQQQQAQTIVVEKSAPPPLVAKPLSAVKDIKLPASPPLPPSLFKTTALPFPNLSIIQPAAIAASTSSSSSVSAAAATTTTTTTTATPTTQMTTVSKPLKEKEKTPPKLSATASKCQTLAPASAPPLFVVPKTPANRSNSQPGGSKYFTATTNCATTMPGSIASALNKPGLHLKRSTGGAEEASSSSKQKPLQPKSPEQDRLVRKTAYGAFFGNSQMGMPMTGIASAKYLKNANARRDNDELPSYAPLSGTYTAEYAKRKLPTPSTSSTKKGNDTVVLTTHHRSAPNTTTLTTPTTSSGSGYSLQLNLVPMSNAPKGTFEIQRNNATNLPHKASSEMHALPQTTGASSTGAPNKTTPRLMGPPPASVPKARKFSPLTLSGGLTTTSTGAIRSPPLLNVPHLSAKGNALHVGHHHMLQHPHATYRSSPPALINLRNTMPLSMQPPQPKPQKLDASKAKTLTTTGLREFRPTSGKEVHIQEILDLSAASTKPAATTAAPSDKRSPPTNPTGNSLEAAINILKQNMSTSCGTVESATKKANSTTLAPTTTPTTARSASPGGSPKAAPTTAADTNRDDLQNLHLLSESATAREKIAIKTPPTSATATAPSKLLTASSGTALLSSSGAAVVRQQNASVRSIPNPSALAFRNQPLQTQNIAVTSTPTSPPSSSSSSPPTTPATMAMPNKSLNSTQTTALATAGTATITTTTTTTGVASSSTTATTTNAGPQRCPKKSTTIDQVAATLNIRAAEASAKAALTDDNATNNSSAADVNAKTTVTTPSLSPPPPPPPSPPTEVPTTTKSATTSSSATVTTKTIGMGQTLVSLVEEPQKVASEKAKSSSLRPPTPIPTATPTTTTSITTSSATSLSATASSLTSISMNNGGINNSVSSSSSSSSAGASPLTLTLSTEKSQITA